ncbi:IclR family transcriptional regulator [Caballeronia sp. LZ043]|nr:IclR family transcriptional regulator [Caballeronia sp. LZ043]
MRSIEKAMSVLTAFDGTKRQLSLSEIAELAALDLSATQRFTYTLATLGYLVKDAASRKYELSVRLLNFTDHFLSCNDLVIRATPYLQQLGLETEEATNLTVLDGTDIVFVLRIVSRNVLNPNVHVGTRLPAYCTALGQAILATFDDGEIDDLLAASDLVAHTPSTRTTPHRIKARLTDVRAKGYAHTKDEFFPGDISTAAAVRGAGGRAIGAVNVAMSPPRWDGRNEHRVAGLVMSTAEAISPHRKP